MIEENLNQILAEVYRTANKDVDDMIAACRRDTARIGTDISMAERVEASTILLLNDLAAAGADSDIGKLARYAWTLSILMHRAAQTEETLAK